MQRIFRIDKVYAERAFKGVSGTLPTIALQVRGSVNTTAWTQPTLVPCSYTNRPDDGILDLDFQATAPTGRPHQTIETLFGLLLMVIPRWVAGVRVHSSTNSMASSLSPLAGDLAGGLSLPPFPWVWQDPESE